MLPILVLHALGWLGGKVAGAASDVVMAPINALASGLADAVGSILATLGTLWVRLDVPNVWNGGTSGTVAFLHSQVAALAGLLAVFGIIVGACRLAWEQRVQPGRDLLQGLLVLVLVTGCGVPVIGLLTSGADAWAQSIVSGATNGTDFGRNVTSMLALSGPALAPVLLIFFGLVALLVSVLQIGLLVFRAGMLVMLAGLLPVAASMATTQSGREHFRKFCAWVVALVAYKPLVALIYLTAFRLIGTHEINSSGAGAILIGLALMTMAIVALPALLRFLVPAVAALSHGGGGGGTALMGAAMALPTGARMLASAGGGASVAAAHGGPGSQGPSGASGMSGGTGGSGPSAASGAPASPGVGAAGQSGAAAATAAPVAAVAGPAAAAAGAAASGVKSAVNHAVDATSTNGGPDGSQH